MAPIPVLDLDTLTDRPRVRVNGKAYELKTQEEFSFQHGRVMAKRFGRLGYLLQAKRLTKKEEIERGRLLDEFCRLVLEAPPEIHQTLREIHRVQVVNHFFQPRLKPTVPTPRHSRRAKPAVQ